MDVVSEYLNLIDEVDGKSIIAEYLMLTKEPTGDSWDDFLYASDKHVAVIAGRRTGKTHHIIQRMINDPYEKILWVGGPAPRAFILNTLNEFSSDIYLTRNQNTFYVDGKEVYYTSAESVLNGSLRGLRLFDAIYFEDLERLESEAFHSLLEITLPMISVNSHGKRIFIVGGEPEPNSEYEHAVENCYKVYI